MSIEKDPDHIVPKMELLDFMNSKSYEEDEFSWISPVNVDYSLELLSSLPEKHAEVWSNSSEDFEDISGRKFRIADVGCGRGKLTEQISAKYQSADVFGIDISAEAIKSTLVRLDDYENAFTVGGDVKQIMSELGEFDFIYAINMVQDTANPVETIEELKNNLRSGGLLAVTVPGKQALEMFPEHQEHDDEIDLPFMQMEEIEAEDKEIMWKQYAFPEERFTEILEDKNLEVVEKKSIPSDASGLPHLMEAIGKEGKKEQAEKMSRLQEENPQKGPKVEFYLLKKR